MKRLVAIVVVAVGLGCAACDDSSAPSDGGLSSVQSTLDSIQSDMAGDGSP
ncbi:hypothetical protein [Amycolatopsis silviterrae]|uniref:Uncharacterized protein n=1 Tax=Amycolatopsis silviterrae TaxID=1656914 RepID=A0ABW5HK23_9PSEU